MLIHPFFKHIKPILLTSLLLTLLLAAIFFDILPVQIVSAETLCKFEGPDVRDDLMLTDYYVEGDPEIGVGGTVIISFKLTYVGKYYVTIDPDMGVFAAAKSPDGDVRIVDKQHRGVTLKSQQSVIFHGEITLNKEGEWLIWPSYCIIKDGKKICGPSEWHACTIRVKTIKTTKTTTPLTPKPDLYISYAWYQALTVEDMGFYYKIKNVGNEPSNRSITQLIIDGIPVAYDEVPPLSPGEERNEVFLGVDWRCTGDSDLIEIVADYNNQISERDEYNNVYRRTMSCIYAVKGVDLILERIWHEPILVEEQTGGTFGRPRYRLINAVLFEIRNRGAGDSGSFDVKLYVDNTEVDSVRMNSLGPGETRTAYFPNFDFSTRCTEPDDVVRVYADPPKPYVGDEIAELDEYNNVITETWRCLDRPDLVVEDIWIIGSSNPSDRTRTRLDSGEEFEVWARIRNIGDTTAPQSIATLSVGLGPGRGVETYTVNIRALNPGAMVEVRFPISFTCDPTVWAYSLRVIVDSTEEITEKNEGNNLSAEFHVSCNIPYPDLVIEDLWLEGFTIKYRIKNQGSVEAGRSTTRLILPTPQGYIALDDQVSRLSPGRSSEESFNYIFDWSQYRDGAPIYYLTIFADFNNNVEEYRGEANNEREFQWRNPGFIKITGRILYQEADAPTGNDRNRGPLNLRDFKPFRFGKLYFRSITDSYKSQVIITDSNGYFSTFIPRVVGRQLRIRIGGEEVLDGNMNYAVRVGRDFDACNEYVGWDSINTITIPDTGDIELGELKVGANQNIDFEGYVQETYIDWICGWRRPLPGGSAYFNIAETILVGRMYADAHRDISESDSIGRVSVAYPDSGPFDFGAPAWENPFYDEIYLTGPREANGYRDLGFVDQIILHEYAHHLSEEISENDWALAIHHKCFCATGLDPGEFAWFEGFAEYFSHLLLYLHSDRSDPHYLSQESADFEWYETPLCDGNVPGLLQEGGVTAFLLDLVDDPRTFEWSVSEDFDRISGLDDMIFKIFDTEMDNVIDAPDIFEFMNGGDGLIARARREGYPSEDDIMLLYRHYQR
ncbi:MAG: CARDB domain-containing protein [Nitrososphaerota archaeon]